MKKREATVPRCLHSQPGGKTCCIPKATTTTTTCILLSPNQYLQTERLVPRATCTTTTQTDKPQYTVQQTWLLSTILPLFPPSSFTPPPPPHTRTDTTSHPSSHLCEQRVLRLCENGCRLKGCSQQTDRQRGFLPRI